MRLIGNTPIHPFFFYTGKLAGYLIWLVFILSAFDFINIRQTQIDGLRIPSFVLGGCALLLIIVSLLNLGKSTSLGVPDETTEFKNRGLYRFSRNPMYLGFNLLTIASMLITGHPVITGLGIYSIVIYHFIIKGEEKFLKQRFGDRYLEYLEKVRRYI